MSQAPNYTPTEDFSQDELNNRGGRSTVDTAALDAEFAAIAQAHNALNANVQLNQRDDGEIRDQRVKLHTLDPTVLKLVTMFGGTVRGAWVTATAYLAKDVVTQSGNTYIAAVAHTSGVFATDLAAFRWVLVQLGAATAASGVPFTPTGTISATNVQAAIDEADTEGRALTVGVDTALRADLLSTASLSKGSGMVGFLYSLIYGAGTVGRWLQDLALGAGSSFIGFIQLGAGAVLQTIQDAIRQQPGINVAHFGAKFDGVANDSAAWGLAKTYAAIVKRPLYLPNGTHLVGAQVFNDLRIGISGESTLGTTIRATAGFTGTLLSFLNTTNNGGDTFERLENFTLQGVYGVGSVGLDVALCSRASMKNLRVQGFDTGIRKINTFCDFGENVEVNDCRVNWQLTGSNHDSEYVRCSSVGAGSSFGGAGTSLLIMNGGADSLQSSIVFRSPDFEFTGASADGVVATMTGTLILDNPYFEQVGGTMIKMINGHCDVWGGEHIIKDTTGFLADVVGAGASVTFDGAASITSDGVTRLNTFLIKSGGAGSVVFERTNIFAKLITNNVMAISPNLGRSVLSAPFLKAMGRQFTKTDYTGVSTVLDTADTRRVTCTTAGTTGVYQAFAVQPRINANNVLVIAYRSNVNFTVTVVGGPGQSGTVGTLGTLVNSSGNLLYGIFPEAKITAAAQLGMEFWRAAWAVGNFLEIVEVWWADGGAIANGQLSLG